MKYIVTGAAGFVGQALVNELISEKNQVLVLVRNTCKIPCEWKENKLLTILAVEMKNYSEIANDIKERDFDVFIHLAWAGTSGMERADVDLQLNNVRYCCDAVRLAASLGCKKFLNAGSIMEYEAMQFIPKDGSQPGMGNIYSTAKMTADFMAKATSVKEGINYNNIIISNIYGAGEKSQRFLNTTLRKMMKNESIPLTHGEQLYDFIYIDDAVKAIRKVAENDDICNEAVYIGNSVQRPLKEFILEMKEAAGSTSELLFGKIPFNGALLCYNEFDTLKLENRLEFTPTISFAKGIELTKQWLEEQE